MATNFPTSLDSYATLVDNTDDVMAAHINDPRDAIEALEAKVGINSSAVTASIDYKVNNFFSSGRKIWIYENTAPTGWTIYSTVEDCVIAVKGGSQAYNVTGGDGAEKGTWTQPDHTLTIDEIPSHYHESNAYHTAAKDHERRGSDDKVCAADGTKTGNTGGGSAHNHGTAYRPLAAVGIIIEKN